MQQADLFAYLAAFVSIVLGLALSDMIESTHRLIRARQRVRWDVLTPLLAVSVFLSLLATFFSLWGDARFDRLTFYGLLAFMAQPILQALVAFAVLPDEVPEVGLELKQFYFDNRRYLVILLILSSVLDLAWVARWAAMHDAFASELFWWSFLPPAILNPVILAAIYFGRSWRTQVIALLANLALAQYAFAPWFIDTVPTA